MLKTKLTSIANNQFWGCSRSSPRGVRLLDHIKS